eukprot:CAMPEP_0116143564 /NCGR_PEP_ID=MMETSP0329-20121206/15519_1 /TAXON_ID=697910 /ORGANISM="Pseudo-nitzschia arenysensis, Strain B593" /LENGTH=249 /DNA_ID=CAMNT_0003638895 /DNA_START=72 /DNA_END=821 /DNA_ORIENTATION=+
MTINKFNNVEPQQLSPRSVNARCFHFYDHMKQNRIPSILRRKHRKRFTNSEATRDPNSPVNRVNDESRTGLEPRTSVTLSSSRCSPSEKILKIIMPDHLDRSSSVPSSFSPPSNKLRMKKVNNEYREVSCTSPRNSVRFHSKVLVMRIPSRNQYPEHMKRNLWCSLSEIARSAQRNTIEFSSEGWDWRSAVEEESMYVHPKTGQYIHPVHVRRAASPAPKSPETMKADSEKTEDHSKNTFRAQTQPAHE